MRIHCSSSLNADAAGNALFEPGAAASGIDSFLKRLKILNIGSRTNDGASIVPPTLAGMRCASAMAAISVQLDVPNARLRRDSRARVASYSLRMPAPALREIFCTPSTQGAFACRPLASSPSSCSRSPPLRPCADRSFRVCQRAGEQLKSAYLECDRRSSQAVLDIGSARSCSLAAEELLQRGFGGDFDKLLAWWRSQRSERLVTDPPAPRREASRPAV